MQRKMLILSLLGALSLFTCVSAMPPQTLNESELSQLPDEMFQSLTASDTSVQADLQQANAKIKELQECQKRQDDCLQQLRKDLKEVITNSKKVFYDELHQNNRNIRQSISELQKKSIQLERHQSDLDTAFHKFIKEDIPKYLIEKYNAKHIKVPGFSDMNDKESVIADALIRVRDREDALEKRLDEKEYTLGIGNINKVDRFAGYVGAALVLNSIARIITVAAPFASTVAPCAWQLYSASRLGAIPGCSFVLGKLCTASAWTLGLGYGLVPLGIWFSAKGVYDVYYRDNDMRKRDSAKQSLKKSCSLIKNSLLLTANVASLLFILGTLAEKK